MDGWVIQGVIVFFLVFSSNVILSMLAYTELFQDIKRLSNRITLYV